MGHLAGLPVFSVTPVDEHRLPGALVVGPLGGALSADRLFEGNQNRTRREKRSQTNVRHLGKENTLGRLLDSAGPVLARSKMVSTERRNHPSSPCFQLTSIDGG